jgi:hypothetical protein
MRIPRFALTKGSVSEDATRLAQEDSSKGALYLSFVKITHRGCLSHIKVHRISKMQRTKRPVYPKGLAWSRMMVRQVASRVSGTLVRGLSGLRTSDKAPLGQVVTHRPQPMQRSAFNVT